MTPPTQSLVPSSKSISFLLFHFCHSLDPAQMPAFPLLRARNHCSGNNLPLPNPPTPSTFPGDSWLNPRSPLLGGLSRRTFENELVPDQESGSATKRAGLLPKATWEPEVEGRGATPKSHDMPRAALMDWVPFSSHKEVLWHHLTDEEIEAQRSHRDQRF